MNFNRVARTVAPADLPVSVEEVRRHLRLMDNLQDEYLIALVDAATAMIDGPFGIGIAMQPQSYSMRLDSLSGTISIPVYPVRTVDHVEWIDKENGLQTSTDFHLDKISNPARVYLNVSGNPIEGSIALHFTAGYDDLPVDLRHAVLMLVGHLFENAEATTATKLEHVPFGVETILNRYRVG